MNRAEATAVNTLTEWLLRIPQEVTAAPTSDEARDALAYLAGRASAQLAAGVTEHAVLHRWERRFRREQATTPGERTGNAGNVPAPNVGQHASTGGGA